MPCSTRSITCKGAIHSILRHSSATLKVVRQHSRDMGTWLLAPLALIVGAACQFLIRLTGAKEAEAELAVRAEAVAAVAASSCGDALPQPLLNLPRSLRRYLERAAFGAQQYTYEHGACTPVVESPLRWEAAPCGRRQCTQPCCPLALCMAQGGQGAPGWGVPAGADWPLAGHDRHSGQSWHCCPPPLASHSAASPGARPRSRAAPAACRAPARSFRPSAGRCAAHSSR